MGKLYLTGIIVHLILLGALWCLNIIVQLSYQTWFWLFDKHTPHDHWLEHFGLLTHEDREGFWVGLFFLGTIGVILGAFTWPFIYPALLIGGILFALRGFIRFKTKVNKALKQLNKDNK